MSNTITLSKQKLDLDEVRMSLVKLRTEIDHRITVLERGMEAIDKGEDMFSGKGILSQEVREIMRNPIP